MPRLLDLRDGRLLVGAECVQSVAGGVAGVALPWLVLERGGGPASAAIIFAAAIGPYAIVGIPAAMAAERFSRRGMLATGYALQAAGTAAIPIAAALGSAPTWFIVAMALVIGSARVIGDAAIFGAVPTLVGREGIVAATGVLTTAWALGWLAGPALGGPAIELVGPQRALAGVSGLYLVSIVLARLLSANADVRAGAGHAAGALLRRGLRFLVRDVETRRFTLVGILWNLLVGGFGALAVPLLHGPLALSAREAGIALAAYGAPGLLVPLALQRLDARFGDGRLFVLFAGASAVVVAAISQAGGIAAVVLLLLPLGFLNMTLGSILPAARQRRAPMALQSLVGTTGRMLNIWGYATGALTLGAIAGAQGVRTALVVESLLLVALTAGAVPVLWRVNAS
jgi:MFS family permease